MIFSDVCRSVSYAYNPCHIGIKAGADVQMCMEASTKKQVSRPGVCITVKRGKGGKKGVAQGH